MDNRMFPLQTDRPPVVPGPRHIPWSIAEKAYGVYSQRHGDRQTLERLAERAGFSWGEMDDLYPAWRKECDELTILRTQLAAAEKRADEAEAEA